MIRDTETSPRAVVGSYYRRLIRSIQARRWQWAIGAVLGAVLYGYVGLRLWRDWRALDLTAFQLRYERLGISLLVHGLGVLLAIVIWMLLLRQMGYAVPFRRHVKVYTASNLARRLPGFVWWLVGRAYMYDRDGIGKLETSAGALLEMMLGAAAAASVGLITMALAGRQVEQVNVWVVVGALAVFLVLLHPRLFALLRRRLRVAEQIPTIGWPRLLFWLLCQMVVVTSGGLTLYWMLAAIYPVPPTAAVSAVQAWALTIVSSSILFWLPIDFGISSAVLILTLNTILPTPVALVVSIAWRCWVVVCEIIWGLWGLLLRDDRPHG